ncbi:PREDICTED: vesicular, overexpressed in cancer, prosurvival protein 1 [Chrysochloris asiatica]|uniref:WW domain binding protein VOPP1 n=1 Tax=Chrysochloris asiatica TaxID=185453 RepID=A0A9B0TK83_CHRAS|nr:PREDICTED: vesicular, overexpressed in cancer, prosurvival protein 1 [Chrysochloris asiatica]
MVACSEPSAQGADQAARASSFGRRRARVQAGVPGSAHRRAGGAARGGARGGARPGCSAHLAPGPALHAPSARRLIGLTAAARSRHAGYEPLTRACDPESPACPEKTQRSDELPSRDGRSAAARVAGRGVNSAFLLKSLFLPYLADKGTEAKKHCWYFEGLYPTYYTCHSYEDCCGSRCCVRALSIQRLWYFWFLLMMGVLFCCGAGFFIRRRMYPPPLIEEPAFNVSYTRQPPNPAAGAQQPGPPYYTDPGGPAMNLVGNPMATAFQIQPNSPQGSTAYPPPPSYCNTPPPPYEQVVKAK